MMSSDQSLSVVVPCYNEELGISGTHRRLTDTLRALDMAYEIVYVAAGRC